MHRDLFSFPSPLILFQVILFFKKEDNMHVIQLQTQLFATVQNAKGLASTWRLQVVTGYASTSVDS